MIGARDMAYPRLNSFGFWMLLFGGIFLNASFFFGGAPDAGWFAYAPLTEPTYSAGRSMDFWAAGLTLLGISSLVGSINIIVTTLKMRCPGMRFNTLPLFVWTTLVQNFLLLFALPSLTTAAIFLLFDRHLGTSFFKAENGGDPLLWQHLFWAFGHPEVYILILPAFGIISEILPSSRASRSSAISSSRGRRWRSASSPSSSGCTTCSRRACRMSPSPSSPPRRR